MRIKPIACAILALAPAVAGCGAANSSSPATVVTVTVPAPVPSTTSSTGSTSTQPPTTKTTTVATTTNSQTRTSTAPAFTRTPGGSDLQSAVAKVQSLGFTPTSTSTYDPNQTLRVLIGTRSGGTGHQQQAFFFDGTKYLGTDASAPSGSLGLTAHGDTDVTIRYGIYRVGDGDCCPTGRSQTVRFALDGGHLVAQDPIPGVGPRR